MPFSITHLVHDPLFNILSADCIYNLPHPLTGGLSWYTYSMAEFGSNCFADCWLHWFTFGFTSSFADCLYLTHFYYNFPVPSSLHGFNHLDLIHWLNKSAVSLRAVGLLAVSLCAVILHTVCSRSVSVRAVC